jgi:hypothetical protein
MSEYTDYMALLIEAETVAELRGALEEVVPWAIVTLPVAHPMDKALAEAEWAALPKPAWVTLAMPSGVGDLMSLGTAFELVVEEDFQSWGLIILCGGDAWNYAMRTDQVFGDSILEREPALTDPKADPVGVAALAKCLEVEPAALTATLIPDGGQAFSAELGIPYLQMVDQNLVVPAPVRVQFTWEIEN